MQTIILGKARYTVADHRTTFLTDILKFTGKHKPVRVKMSDCPKRVYPRVTGLSTAEYVRSYYATNGLSMAGFYENLSDRVTVPEGFDSMEVEL